MSADDHAVTPWLALLKAGDPAAAQPLWEHYFERLVGYVRNRLPAASPLDDEGLASSAFHGMCVAVAAGRFPKLDDRHDLWRVLVTVAVEKIADGTHRAYARKRGGAAVHAGPEALGDVPGRDPGPETAALVADLLAWLLAALPDDQHRQVVLWKLDGLSNEEIAGRLGRAVRTVGNRLDVIRKTLTAGGRA